MAEASGRIPVYIGSSVVMVKQFSSDKKTKQISHKYSDGSRARSEGQPDFTWSMTCSVMKDKQTILQLIEAEKARGELNIAFVLGSEEYLLENCGVDSEGVSSDQDGTADLTISGIATDRIKTR